MKYTAACVTTMSLFLSTPAFAQSVYPGCSISSLKSGHHTFYVDPVNGSMTGDGSASKPWSTLGDVLDPSKKLVATQSHAYPGYRNGTDIALHAVNPNGPIKAGDLILLKTGNHGKPKLSNMFNSDFITIAAAPGATPIVGQIDIASSAKWLFQGLTFEGVAVAATGATSVPAAPTGILNALNLVTVGQGDWIGQTSDIAFTDDTFRTAASTSGWTDYDWYVKPMNYMFAIRSPCTSITNSHFVNVANAIAAAAPKVLVQGNIIESFSNDAIDISDSFQLIKGNTIRNGVNKVVDPLHADGIQGLSPTVNGVMVTNTNVVIDGNTITKSGDTAVSYLQGISIFGGKWDGLVVQNNVVTTNHWNALAIYGAQNSRVLNNTVVASDPVGHPSWIQIHDGSDGTKSTALVRNNIATVFNIQSPGTTLDHNIAAKEIDLPTGAVKSGTTGTANAVLPAVLTGFMTLNTTSGAFDMRLRSTSPAIGFGTLLGAPALDIMGNTRSTPVDIGAYNHTDTSLSAVSK